MGQGGCFFRWGVIIFFYFFFFFYLKKNLSAGCQVGITWVRESVRWGVFYFLFFFCVKKKRGVRWVLNGSGRVSGGVLLFCFISFFIFKKQSVSGCQAGVKCVR